MQRMIRQRMIRQLFFLGLCFWGVSGAYAYTDKIDATTQEIYNAATTCFSEGEILKKNPEEKSLTTKWAYSRIRRSRKRRFVPMNLKENVDLRSQMQIDITEGKNYSEVSVQGRFEEKATDAPPQLHWKNAVSSKELYFKERDIFVKILGCLEAQKKASSATTSTLV